MDKMDKLNNLYFRWGGQVILFVIYYKDKCDNIVIFYIIAILFSSEEWLFLYSMYILKLL